MAAHLADQPQHSDPDRLQIGLSPLFGVHLFGDDLEEVLEEDRKSKPAAHLDSIEEHHEEHMPIKLPPEEMEYY